MLLRAIPLLTLLFWLAYQAHFSPSFFAQTVGEGMASIAGGIRDVLSGEYEAKTQKVAARAE